MGAGGGGSFGSESVVTELVPVVEVALHVDALVPPSSGRQTFPLSPEQAVERHSAYTFAELVALLWSYSAHEVFEPVADYVAHGEQLVPLQQNIARFNRAKVFGSKPAGPVTKIDRDSLREGLAATAKLKEPADRIDLKMDEVLSIENDWVEEKLDELVGLMSDNEDDPQLAAQLMLLIVETTATLLIREALVGEEDLILPFRLDLDADEFLATACRGGLDDVLAMVGQGQRQLDRWVESGAFSAGLKNFFQDCATRVLGDTANEITGRDEIQAALDVELAKDNKVASIQSRVETNLDGRLESVCSAYNEVADRIARYVDHTEPETLFLSAKAVIELSLRGLLAPEGGSARTRISEPSSDQPRNVADELGLMLSATSEGAAMFAELLGLLRATVAEPGKPDQQREVPADFGEIEMFSTAQMAEILGISITEDSWKVETSAPATNERFLFQPPQPVVDEILVFCASRLFRICGRARRSIEQFESTDRSFPGFVATTAALGQARPQGLDLTNNNLYVKVAEQDSFVQNTGPFVEAIDEIESMARQILAVVTPANALRSGVSLMLNRYSTISTTAIIADFLRTFAVAFPRSKVVVECPRAISDRITYGGSLEFVEPAEKRNRLRILPGPKLEVPEDFEPPAAFRGRAQQVTANVKFGPDPEKAAAVIQQMLKALDPSYDANAGPDIGRTMAGPLPLSGKTNISGGNDSAGSTRP